MVKEGSVPKKTIENQFGDVDIDELEAVLTKRTLPYQEKVYSTIIILLYLFLTI